MIEGFCIAGRRTGGREKKSPELIASLPTAIREGRVGDWVNPAGCNQVPIRVLGQPAGSLTQRAGSVPVRVFGRPLPTTFVQSQ